MKKAGLLQLIQNSTPSVALMRQCINNFGIGSHENHVNFEVVIQRSGFELFCN